MRGATRGLPRSEGRGGGLSPDFAGVSGGRFPCSSYGIATDRRIFRISRFHPGALVEAVLVNSGTKYRVDCGGGGVADFGAGGIKSREGHSFEPHSLIAVGLQRLSGIDDMG
uniref:Uncharacterized protein n=1 Tax=Salix viminalis TaxID=40686 RepID=A0A6N2LH38_SALVM